MNDVSGRFWSPQMFVANFLKPQYFLMIFSKKWNLSSRVQVVEPRPLCCFLGFVTFPRYKEFFSIYDSIDLLSLKAWGKNRKIFLLFWRKTDVSNCFSTSTSNVSVTRVATHDLQVWAKCLNWYHSSLEPHSLVSGNLFFLKDPKIINHKDIEVSEICNKNLRDPKRHQKIFEAKIFDPPSLAISLYRSFYACRPITNNFWSKHLSRTLTCVTTD